MGVTIPRILTLFKEGYIYKKKIPVTQLFIVYFKVVHTNLMPI